MSGSEAYRFPADEALILQAQILDLRGPGDRALAASRDYVEGTAVKSFRLPLISGKAKTYLSNTADLAALRKADVDMLSRVLQDHWLV